MFTHDIMCHDVARLASGWHHWHHLRHAIPSHVQTVWPRKVKFGVLVTKTYLYLLTKFHLPEIKRLDVTLRIVMSCNVMHQECLGVIKSNTIFIVT